MIELRHHHLILILIACILLVLPVCSGSCTAINRDKAVSTNSTTVYFTREGTDPALILTNLYQKAGSYIEVAIYSITHPDIIGSLLNAVNRGIKIRVISDRYQTSGLQKQALDSMAAAGIMIKLNRTQGSMHLKMSIIDKTIVTLGSYNYTQSGSKYNDEVLTVIKDPEAISGCIRQFEDMWKDNKNYSNYR